MTKYLRKAAMHRSKLKIVTTNNKVTGADPGGGPGGGPGGLVPPKI